MRIILVILFIFIMGCGGPTTPSDSISLEQVGPYKYNDADRMWKYCSHPESEPSESLCGICHWIY